MNTPEQECPGCKTKLDAADPLNNDNSPAPGDLSVCYRCGSFLVFDEGLSIRLMRVAEIEALEDDDRNLMLRARRAIQQMRAS